MKLSFGKSRSSRIAAYLLIVGSLLAVCNVAVQPVSSQAFDTSTSTRTSTQTNTATYFTVSAATSNLIVTVLTVQYTTATSIFTVQNVQFTTLTSFVTHIEVQQPTSEPAPAYHTSDGSESAFQPYHNGRLHAARIDGNSILGYTNADVTLQLITLAAVIFAFALLIREKK